MATGDSNTKQLYSLDERLTRLLGAMTELLFNHRGGRPEGNVPAPTAGEARSVSDLISRLHTRVDEIEALVSRMGTEL